MNIKLFLVGVLIFFGAGAADYFLEWCPSGHIISIIGASLSTFGLIISIRKFFKEFGK